ncbi:MAG: phytanoyl-CoA dioxygenase family protein [Sphingomonadaceae bacterium]|jgi:hypothetical protein
MSLSSSRSALRWLMLPWWIAQLFTGAKSFRDNPLIGSKRLNRLGLHGWRVRTAHWLAARRRARLGKKLSAEDREQFERQGYVLISNFLPTEEFESLRSALLARAYPAREMVQGNAITRRIAINTAMLLDVPALRSLIRMPRWASLMRYVASFDIEPLYYIQTILTHRADGPPDPQLHLHDDTFHPTMKAWYFLSDVTEDDGPLTYVDGSHRLTAERLAWENSRALQAPEGMDFLSSRGSLRIEPEELPVLGLPPATHFTVPANTLVVVDTCGFHARGEASRPSMRIEIWAYSRRNPFTPWSGMDVFSLSGLAERRIGALWALRDRLKRWVGQPWTPVGTITADHDRSSQH